MRILIAEDEKVAQKVLQRFFFRLGHEVFVAENGKKAFEIFEKWDGFHLLDTKGAGIFYTLHYYLVKRLFKDELGEDFFKAFLRTRLPDKAILKIMSLENSPWWDDKTTSKKESQKDILSSAWFQTIDNLKQWNIKNCGLMMK